MFLRIRASEDSPVTLEEPDDFTRFHVEVVDLDVENLRHEVDRSGIGYVTTEGDVAVAVAAIRLLVGNRSPRWDVGFDRMVTFARSKGWMPDHEHIRAHCVRA
jgi:hypothetical protein